MRCGSARLLGYLTDFARLNRRMHNKSFTVDGQATIVGGRNIGDEYFGAAGEVLFADLDVLAIGPVVQAVSARFRPLLEQRVGVSAGPDRRPADAGQRAARQCGRRGRSNRRRRRRIISVAIRESTFVAESSRAPACRSNGPATRLVSDDPAKALDRAAPESRVGPQLRQSIGEPATSNSIWFRRISCPARTGTAAFSALARRGVAVRVLTNSLEATDVAAVHAGYAKWRKPLLEAGVKLYELRRSWPQDAAPKRAGPLRQFGIEPACEDIRGRRRRAYSSAHSISIRVRRA